jgi:two-component system sensor histidine kinase KdpD
VTRDHHVKVSLDNSIPPLSIDRAAAVEALYILLDNASKYAPAGTIIAVSAGREDERSVRIAVSDEGPGIPDHLRERVFEKFFRVPARESHDPNRGGVGLGLPIARRLIETQGGHIWVERPASRKGTAVIMTLPAAAAAEAAAELRTEDAEPGSEGTESPSNTSSTSSPGSTPRTLTTVSTLRTERTG